MTRVLLTILVLLVGVILSSIYLMHVIFNPPPLIFGQGDVDMDIPKNAPAGLALAWQARKFVGTDLPRVEGRGFFKSADLFVKREDWEKLAYPDRATVGSILARAWCARVIGRTRLTSVHIRDIQSGEELRTCYCE